MALKKTLTLPEGYSAEYIRFERIEEFSRTDKKATCIFALYKDQATCDAGGAPVKPFAFRLRLTGAKFDQYFSPTVLTTAFVIAQAYAAAKTESVDTWTGSGKLLADAIDA